MMTTRWKLKNQNMTPAISKRLKVYQFTAIFSVLFALLGFSYNVWRLELSEQNNSIRIASFEILLQLAELENLVYAAHYDKNTEFGNPRKGWVKVGLINDLSVLTDKSVSEQSIQLKNIWNQHWSSMSEQRVSADVIVQSIDKTRRVVKRQIQTLQ